MSEDSEGLIRRLGAANKVITDLQLDVERLTAERDLLLAEKKQWEQSKVMQEQIVSMSINGANERYQEQAQLIQELRDRLRKYEGE